MANPDSKRSLVVTIGASRFPKAPQLCGGSPFSRSVEAFLAYLCADYGFGLHRSNVLDLFDDSRPATEQLEEIGQFLQDKQRNDRSVQPENLLIYYVGHGLFTPNDRKYCLALRCTNGNNIGLSAMRGRDLAEVVSNCATHLRRFLVLDCCFAGSMLGEFLSAPGEAANVQMMEELPPKGTTLLCASSSQDVALAVGLEYTMFSDALLKALWKGNSTLGERLSMRELKDTVQGRLRNDYPSNWVRPELHSPDMRMGDISSVPLFPNPGWSGLQAVAAKEAERIKIVDAERLRVEEEKAEAQRIKAAEAERRRREREEAEAKAAVAERLRLEQKKAEAERLKTEDAERERLKRKKAEAAEIERLHLEREKAEAKAAETERLRLERENAEAAIREESAAPLKFEKAPTGNTELPGVEGSRKWFIVTVAVVGLCIAGIIFARLPFLHQPKTSGAMYDLASKYESSDPKQAAVLYRKAADAGDNGAMFRLGTLYESGKGVDKDPKQAAAWYTKAANAGNCTASYKLGGFNEEGYGVNKDVKQAVVWYTKAANNGCPAASERLGLLYAEGTGVDKDPKQAAIWFRKAADAGYSNAMFYLGRLYDDGQGVGKDPTQAAAWYRKAADEGDSVAMNNLGTHYESGRGVDKDPTQAAAWYRKAADAGNSVAMNNLGALYDNGKGVDKDPRQAAAWYRKAADAGNSIAMCNLGILYEYGQGVDKDPTQAAAWYRKAADAGDSVAMNYLGMFYEYGTGVHKDLNQAVTLYRKSAALGDKDAMANLKRLGARP